MSKIEIIEKSKTIDYGQSEHTNFWLKKSVGEIPTFSQEFTFPATQANGIICIMCECIDDKNLINAIRDAEGNGCRVYILASTQSKESQALEDRCLVRYTNGGIIGSFVLDVGNRTGLFLNGNLDLILDEKQTDILYRHFCYHFWNTEDNPPFSVFPNLDNFCDSDYVQNVINEKKELTFVQNIQSNIKSQKIVTSLTGNNTDILTQIAKSGVRILALKNGNPIYAIENEKSMFVFPKTTYSQDDLLWALELNDDQKILVKNYLEILEKNADYEFVTSKKRAELKNEKVLPLGETTEIHIQSENDVDLGNKGFKELTPRDEFEKYEPIADFKDDGRTIEVKYKWKNVPFGYPQNAKKHELYDNWEKASKRVMDFLDGILNKIDETEKKESTFAEAIARMVLGKKTIFYSLKREIDELKVFDFANAPNNTLEEKIKRINDISQEANKHITDISEEDRKAKIDEEIEKLKQAIAEKENALKNLEQKKDEEIAKKESAKAEKQDNKAQDKEIGIIKSKYQSDSDKIKKEIKGLEHNIDKEEKKKKNLSAEKSSGSSPLEVFVDNKQKSTSSANVETLVVKLQPLPKAGELYQVGKESYLAITDWDEYNIGKEESKRLNAKLCVKRSE